MTKRGSPLDQAYAALGNVVHEHSQSHKHKDFTYVQPFVFFGKL